MQYGPKIVTNGLVLCVDAADLKSSARGASTAWKDLSGNNNNATLTGGAVWDSRGRGSILFDGVNDYALFTTNSSVNLTNNITFEFFVFISSFVSVGGVMTYGSETAEQYAVFTDNAGGNKLVLATNWPTNWQQARTTVLNVDQWYYAACTFSSSAWIWYINGEFNTSGTFAISSFPAVVGADMRFGVNHPGGDEYYNGRIALGRIYNRVLSATEIRKNFIAQRSKFNI